MIFHLRAEITRLVRENEDFFNVDFLLSELGKKYTHLNLTESDILEVYEQNSLLDFFRPFKLVSDGRSNVVGGEGGN